MLASVGSRIACWVVCLLGTPFLSLADAIQVMTFTGIPQLPGSAGADVWVEDGITATGFIASSGHADEAYIDGGASEFASTLDFTTGGRFDVISIDIRPGGSGYCATLDWLECQSATTYDPFEYIWITGFVAGTQVASLGLYRPAGDVETILLGEFFPSIDLLRIQVRPYFELGLTGSCDVGQGCGQVDVDNVTLRAAAPIPEPGSGLLFAVASIIAGGGALTSGLCTRHRSR